MAKITKNQPTSINPGVQPSREIGKSNQTVTPKPVQQSGYVSGNPFQDLLSGKMDMGPGFLDEVSRPVAPPSQSEQQAMKVIELAVASFKPSHAQSLLAILRTA